MELFHRPLQVPPLARGDLISQSNLTAPVGCELPPNQSCSASRSSYIPRKFVVRGRAILQGTSYLRRLRRGQLLSAQWAGIEVGSCHATQQHSHAVSLYRYLRVYDSTPAGRRPSEKERHCPPEEPLVEFLHATSFVQREILRRSTKKGQ
jgi:hypothetical protein